MPKRTMLKRKPPSSSEAHTMAASFAAIGSIFAATSCCLPVLPFAMAAGLAGTSTFLSEIRPHLLAASIVCIAYGFYQSRRAKTCQRRTNVFALILLWLSAAFVFISILFPQLMANAIAGIGSR